MTMRAIIPLLVLFVFAACHDINGPKPAVRDGKRYGVTKGAFKGNWWDYYERALSFSDGAFWEEAEKDLRKAVKKRSDDERHARTYGTRFIGYFAHCELGIALFEQGRIEEAIREFETSLSTVTTSRAQQYLDKARKKLIAGKHADPPKIQILSPDPNDLKNTGFVDVRGRVSDRNNFVARITVGGKDFRMDVSKKETEFRMRVPLGSGRNEIVISAENLAGKTSEKKVCVISDRFGPVIAIDRTELPVSGSQVRVTGYVYDKSGLSEIVFNGKKRDIPDESTRYPLDETISTGGSLRIEACDRAGNKTSAVVPPASGRTRNLPGVMLASRSSGNLMCDLPGTHSGLLNNDSNTIRCGTSMQPVRICLNDSRRFRTTFLEESVIDGFIETGETSFTLFVNGKEVFGSREIPQSSSMTFHFQNMVSLKSGKNPFRIEVRTGSGLSDKKKLEIERQITQVRKKECRLRVYTANFHWEEKDAELSSRGFEKKLAKELNGYERFNTVGFSEGKPVSKEEAVKIAGKKAFDCVLHGSITERYNPEKDYMITFAAEIENIGGDTLVTKDVYVEFVRKSDIEGELTKQSRLLANKLVEELPLADGFVREVKGERIRIDIGSDEKVRKGIPLLVYRQGSPDADSDILGEACVKEANPDSSLALLAKDAERKSVQPMCKVITK